MGAILISRISTPRPTYRFSQREKWRVVRDLKAGEAAPGAIAARNPTW
jgi:hypothetical protein